MSGKQVKKNGKYKMTGECTHKCDKSQPEAGEQSGEDRAVACNQTIIPKHNN